MCFMHKHKQVKRRATTKKTCTAKGGCDLM